MLCSYHSLKQNEFCRKYRFQQCASAALQSVLDCHWCCNYEVERMRVYQVVFTVKEDLPFVHSFLDKVQSAATPLGLLVMGGQFDFTATKSMGKEIVIGSLARLIFAPLVGVGLGILLSNYTGLIHLGQSEYPALVALCGTPTAVSSAIMAGEMDNDQQLAVQLVVWTSIGSVFTVFGIICALMGMGLLAI